MNEERTYPVRVIADIEAEITMSVTASSSEEAEELAFKLIDEGEPVHLKLTEPIPEYRTDRIELDDITLVGIDAQNTDADEPEDDEEEDEEDAA